MVDSTEQLNASDRTQPAAKIAGTAAVAIGILGISFGSLWAQQALDFFAANVILSKAEIIVPFLPILLIAAGTLLIARSRR